MIEDPTIIKWKRWDSDKLTKCMDPHIETGTKYQYLKVLGDDMKDLALHLFDMWLNYSQLNYIMDPETLEYDHLVQVRDFGRNYLNQFQDEPQSLFWYHTQTVMHPIINYYRCPQCPKKIVSDEHIIISDNRKHDKQVVQTFEEVSLGFLASEGIVPTKKIQFCDNYLQQYESRGCFYYMSKSDVPLVRCYFGTRHGKGPVDGCVG